MRDRIVRAFGYFKEARAWAALIAVINLVGIAYGFYYYSDQFFVTPAWLWWLVPDSPLAVLWAELALACYWLLPRDKDRKWLWLDALAFIGNVQVGLWTCYVLLAYPGFGTLDFLHGGTVKLNTILWVGHFGMAILGLVFVKGIRDARAYWAIAIAAGYYLVNDVMDYFGPDYVGRGCGMRPYTVPCNAQEPMLTVVTFGLTIAATSALILLMARPESTGKSR